MSSIAERCNCGRVKAWPEYHRTHCSVWVDWMNKRKGLKPKYLCRVLGHKKPRTNVWAMLGGCCERCGVYLTEEEK